MANASANFEADFLELLFQNTDITGIGDATGLQGSPTAGSLYIRLCTDAVTATDTTLGTECAYTSYVAKGVAVARSAVGWEIDSASPSTIQNAADVEFAQCTGGTETIKYVEVWKNNTGSTIADRIAWVELSATLAVSNGVTPKFAAGELTFEFD